MEEVPTMLVFSSGTICLWIRGVRPGLQRRAVHGQQPIAPKFLLGPQKICKLAKQVLKRRRKQLLPLLDERRRRRRIYSPLEMPKQSLLDTFFVHSEDEINQHSGR